MAQPDGQLRTAPKYLFRNDIISNANAIETNPPKNARWIIDGMALMRAVKCKKTYKLFFDSLIKFSSPNTAHQPKSIEFVNEIYRSVSAKNGTRGNRGEESRRVTLTGIEQNMLSGKEWLEFFHNIENKEDLISLFATYLKSEDWVSQTTPVYFTRKAETWEHHHQTSRRIGDCNHEEADTRMLIHALRENTNVVIVARDTDVLMIMIYIYALKEVTAVWYMKYGAEKFANIGKIVKHLGRTVSLMLVHLHCITGCDTTSYMYGVGKARVLNKVLKDVRLLELLETLGCKSGVPDNYRNIEKFIQTVCYAGRIDESLVETRVRLYEKQKVKTSQSLPADPDSMKQAILRINYQMYYWKRSDQAIVDEIPLEENGWNVDEESNSVTPIWFEGQYLIF